MSVRIQFGHGGHMLDGWINLEQHQADITKPLAFKDDSVDFILIEHCLEHVSPQDGYKFLLNAHRILKPSGVIRVVVPDIEKVWLHCDDRYKSMLKESAAKWWTAAGLPVNINLPFEPTDRDAVEALIFCHGHKSIYTEELLGILMEIAGFDTVPCEYRKSNHPEL